MMANLFHYAKRAVQQIASAFGLFVARYQKGYVYIDKGFQWTPPTPLDRRDQELFYSIAKPVVQTGRTLLNYDRLQTLWQAARNVYRLELPAAEVGSYKGGSAYFIASALKTLGGHEFPVHVFDTFEGHPPVRHERYDTAHRAGLFGDTDYETVKAYLAPHAQAFLHKGEFSESAKFLPNMTFSLVHIDVDLYQSTLDALRYFGQRLCPGGIMIVDDYDALLCPGVNQAARDYLNQNHHFAVWQMQTEQLIMVRISPDPSSPAGENIAYEPLTVRRSE